MTLTLTIDMTLTFNLLQAMVMNYSQAKVQGQWSVGSEDRVETNGKTERWTEVISLPPLLMWVAINRVYSLSKQKQTVQALKHMTSLYQTHSTHYCKYYCF